MKNAIIRELQNRGYEVEEKSIQKNGVMKDALVIGKSGDTIRPSVYIDAYLTLADFTSAEEITDRILESIERANKENEIAKYLTLDLTDKDFIARSIQISVQRAGSDSVIKRPTEFDGIEQFLTISLDGARIRVSDDSIHLLDFDDDELWDIALKNTIKTGTVESLQKVIAELMGVPEECCPIPNPVYVVSNTTRSFGASQILNDELLKGIAEKHDVKGVYIIPSSVHELLVIPSIAGINIDVLTSMVTGVNGAKVLEEEQLSDIAYYREF